MRSGGAYETFKPNWHESSVVNKLIIFTSIIFVLDSLNRGLTPLLWLSVPSAAEFWRFGTYMFVHGNFMHILFNMWSLYIFGKPVEQKLGSSAFLKLYLISGVIGGVSWVLFNLRSTIPLVGASGAIFGVMAAAAMLFPSMQIMLLLPPVTLKVKTLVICLAIVNILMLYKVNSNIAYLAHLGGLLGGFLFIKKYLSQNQRRQSIFDNKGHGIGTLVQTMKSSFGKKVNTSEKHAPDLRFVTKDHSPNEEDIITTEIDPILDKIGKFGMQSLTTNERKILERARDKLKDQS